MEKFFETFLNCQVKFTHWRWIQINKFNAIIPRDNYFVDLKKQIGFGFLFWESIKTCKPY